MNIPNLEQQLVTEEHQVLPVEYAEQIINGHYFDIGNRNGQPIVIIHGWLGSNASSQLDLAHALIGQVRHLSNPSQGIQNLLNNDPDQIPDIYTDIYSLRNKGYRVIVPELPGFGVTSPIKGVNMDGMANYIYEFINKLED